MPMKKLIAVVAALALSMGAAWGLTSVASAAEPSVTKYNTAFAYQGDNTWTVTPLEYNVALHNIGAKQSWLCNQNNVGPGIEPCVVGKTYITNGDIFGDRSCVYIQGDGPAWDTVPNTEKEVCAPISTPTPTATSSPSPTESSSPSPTTTLVPTPTPTSTDSPSPTSTPSPSPSMTSTPGPTSSASPTPEPSVTPTTRPTSTPGSTPSASPSSTPTSSVPSPNPTSTTSAPPIATSTPPLICADFSTQTEAQAALPTNPQLDADGDGTACDAMASSPSSPELAVTGSAPIGPIVTTGILILLAGIVLTIYVMIRRRG